MCGISVTYRRGSQVSLPTDLVERLQRRGPDHIGNIPVEFANGSLFFVSSVLSLRSKNPVIQPLKDPHTGSILCWNGEAWKLDDRVINGNDTEVVLGVLLQATASYDSQATLGYKDKVEEAVVNALSRILGPYAFIYYDARHCKVFYGRDRLGRRSLLTCRGQDDSLMVSSVPCSSSSGIWTEVEANGIYVISAETTKELKPLESHIAWPVTEDQPSVLSLYKHNSRPGSSQASELGISVPTVDALLKNLQSSLAIRVLAIPSLPSNTIASAKVAILFSGGLDCTLIARIVHDLLPQDQDIDLLNVAFENPRVLRAVGATDNITVDAFSQCPDRVTGLKSYAELQRVCPGRRWRFVHINIAYSEFISHRPQIISLMYPHQTEMDLSIACALYFAARGSGTVRSGVSGDYVPYITAARVLLSGLGADELFAGYTRHATAFARQGYEGLANELMLDYQRLGRRNLGRDDRVISHWAREVRYPYLDEGFLRWALPLPLWKKCGFGNSEKTMGSLNNEDNPMLEPSKKLLRLLSWNLGMKSAATEKKRAIQFGARSAKMEAGKTKGTEILS
ncbi:MAG: hypothetical protein Q9209_003294 [Squamulea sp. 1 TL-2023]